MDILNKRCPILCIKQQTLTSSGGFLLCVTFTINYAKLNDYYNENQKINLIHVPLWEFQRGAANNKRPTLILKYIFENIFNFFFLIIFFFF